MHQQAFRYIERRAAHVARGANVLEIGSYNVNGSVRPLFGRKYHGIDVREGPGVDEAIKAQDFDGKGAFDVVVTTETLEHDDDPEGLIAAAWKALKPGGVLLLTAAGPERAPHNSNGGHDLGDEHYRNVTPTALKGWLKDWDEVEIERDERAGDIYARAVKPKEETPTKAKRAKAEEAEPKEADEPKA
jgi:SAM-dependent methyltransferase